MPQTQVANVGVYSFGAPAVAAQVLLFKVIRPGKLIVTFEAGQSALGVQLKVCATQGGSYVAVAAAQGADFGSVVTVKAKCTKTYAFTLRDAKDLFLKLEASGLDRGEMHVRGDAVLDPVVV